MDLRPLFATLVAATLALAGCVGSPEEASAPDEPLGTTEVDAAPEPPADSGAGDEPLEPAGPQELTFYMTGSRGLSQTAPDEGRIADEAFFFDPQAQIGEWIPPRSALDTPLRSGVRLLSAHLDFFLTTDTPQVPLSAAFGFDPVVVWLGDTDGQHGVGSFHAGPQTMAPGDVVHVSVPLELPPGGLVYPAGSTPEFVLAAAYSQGPGNPLYLLVGGETATRVTVSAEPFEPQRTAGAASETVTGAFTGNLFVAPHPDEAETMREFPVVIDATTARFAATLTGSAAALHHDLDLSVHAPDGSFVWASTQPNADERVVLFEPNFAAAGFGEYTVRVHNFQGIESTFTLTLETAQKAPAPGA